MFFKKTVIELLIIKEIKITPRINNLKQLSNAQ